MEELIATMIIQMCQFDSTKITRDKKLACGEVATNCIVNKKDTLDDCVNKAKQELK